MLSVQRHNLPAGASFHVLAKRLAEPEQVLIDRPQLLFGSCVLLLDVLNGRLQVRLRRVLPALSFRSFRNPRCLVSPKLVHTLQPVAPGPLVFGPSFFTSTSHSSMERPVSSFSSANHFCTIVTLGCTP